MLCEREDCAQGAGHKRCHAVPSYTSIAAFKHWLLGLGARFWCWQAPLWGSVVRAVMHRCVCVCCDKCKGKKQVSAQPCLFAVFYVRIFCIPWVMLSCSGMLAYPMLAQLHGEFDLMGAGSCFPSRGAPFPASHPAHMLSAATLLSFAKCFNNS